MAKSRSRTLKGRGIGPSKVAPAEVEEDVIEEPIVIDVNEEGARDTFAELVGKTGWSYDDAEVDSVFESVPESITVTTTKGIPTQFVLDGTRTIESQADLTKEAEAATAEATAAEEEDAVEGASRRRLKKKARRTKRNRRALKGKKLRKFTTRRR
jgi:hypothetical protein